MGILITILLGLIAGALANFLLPGKAVGGFIATTLLGIAGAFVGGFLANLLGIGDAAFELSIGSIISATIGAIVLVLVFRLITKAAK